MKRIQKRKFHGRIYWKQLIREESSSQTVEEFSEDRDVGQSTFNAWSRRLRLDSSHPRDKAKQFVQLYPQSEPVNSRVCVRCGEFSIELADRFDDRILQLVLRIVRSATLGEISNREASDAGVRR